MKNIFVLISLAAVFSVSFAQTNDSASIPSAYENRTESDFVFKLILDKKGGAKFAELDPENGKTSTMVGKWKSSSTIVTITFPKDGVYIYRAVGDLSWSDFGCKGMSFGLENLSTPTSPKGDYKYNVWRSSDMKNAEQCESLNAPIESDKDQKATQQAAPVPAPQSAPSKALPEVSAPPTTTPTAQGFGGFLKGLTASINDAARQLKSKPEESPRTNSESPKMVSNPSDSAPTLPTATVAEAPKKDLPPSIRTTRLKDIFTKAITEKSPKSLYPRVAFTITDWSAADCWSARAKIWWSEKKSEAVPPFSVCWQDSFDRAATYAVYLRMFIGQLSLDNTGNARTEGPKAPTMAVPLKSKFGISEYKKGQQNNSFIQQMIIDTGWQPTDQTNFWFVEYEEQK